MLGEYICSPHFFCSHAFFLYSCHRNICICPLLYSLHTTHSLSIMHFFVGEHTDSDGTLYFNRDLSHFLHMNSLAVGELYLYCSAFWTVKLSILYLLSLKVMHFALFMSEIWQHVQTHLLLLSPFTISVVALKPTLLGDDCGSGIGLVCAIWLAF